MEYIIDQAFAQMIGTYRIYKKLGISREHVKTLRYQVKQGITISLDKKHRLLRKAGWKMDAYQYTDHDLLDVIKFCINTGTSAKTLGAGYVMDKWKANR